MEFGTAFGVVFGCFNILFNMNSNQLGHIEIVHYEEHQNINDGAHYIKLE